MDRLLGRGSSIGQSRHCARACYVSSRDRLKGLSHQKVHSGLAWADRTTAILLRVQRRVFRGVACPELDDSRVIFSGALTSLGSQYQRVARQCVVGVPDRACGNPISHPVPDCPIRRRIQCPIWTISQEPARKTRGTGLVTLRGERGTARGDQHSLFVETPTANPFSPSKSVVLSRRKFCFTAGRGRQADWAEIGALRPLRTRAPRRPGGDPRSSAHGSPVAPGTTGPAGRATGTAAPRPSGALSPRHPPPDRRWSVPRVGLGR
jgi:hypothetical protein